MVATYALPGLGLSDREDEPQVLNEKGQLWSWIAIGVLTAMVGVVYFDRLWSTVPMWFKAQYQYGFIIPVISAVLLWTRRKPFVAVPAWHRWIGVGLILLATLIRVESSRRTVFYFDNLSLIPCLLGVFAMVGGLSSLRWAAPGLLFLVFMFPFPYPFERMLMHPLQREATKFSTAALVTLGVDAVRDGNSIYLPNRTAPMNVAEQCSGLRMSTILTGMTVAFALFATSRPLWERLLVVLSAIPIAFIVNVTRITLTGLLYTGLSLMGWKDDLFETVSHDFAGSIMILMAFGLLLLEFQLLKHLVVEDVDEVRSLHAVP